MWTVLPISLRATELEKDELSCIPDVCVFTCSLWKRLHHLTENHASERCFGARDQERAIIVIIYQPKGINGHWLKKARIF